MSTMTSNLGICSYESKLKKHMQHCTFFHFMHSFIKIIDIKFKAYLFLEVIIHIFLLEAILLTETKIQRSYMYAPNPT